MAIIVNVNGCYSSTSAVRPLLLLALAHLIRIVFNCCLIFLLGRTFLLALDRSCISSIWNLLTLAYLIELQWTAFVIWGGGWMVHSRFHSLCLIILNKDEVTFMWFTDLHILIEGILSSNIFLAAKKYSFRCVSGHPLVLLVFSSWDVRS